MTAFVISTLFKGVDNLSPIFKRQSAAAGRFGDRASRSFAKASRSASSFGTTVKGVLAAGAVQKGLSGLAMGLRGVTEEFVDFDDALTRAGAKFPVAVKRGTDSFEKLGEVARKVGAEPLFTAADAARGLDFLAMAGFNAAQSMAALPKVTDLATIANTDLARSTDIASDTLGAFNLMTKDSVQLEKNLARVTDVMAATVTSANTDIEQLFETMKFAGPVATNAGASIETFNTIAAEMANAGIKGSLAGTALRTAFLNMSSPVPKAKALLRKLRIEVKDSSGNMRDMLDILDDVRQRTSKMGTAQKTAALNVLFGRRAVAGMSAVLNASNAQLREYRSSLEAAGGASKRMAGDIRKSIGNRLKELKSALIEIGFKFFEAFVGKGEGALDRLIVAVRNFDIKPVVEGVKAVSRVLSVAFDGVKIFATAIKDVIGILFEYDGALKAVAITLGIAKVAQWALNAAMLANPIGLVIAAIGAAIVVVTVLINKWESATASMNLAAIGLRNMVLNVFDSIKSAAISMVNAIIGAINQIPSVDIPKFELPDNSERIKRDIELIRARNKLLIAAVKDSDELQQKAKQVGESIRGQQKAAEARRVQILQPGEMQRVRQAVEMPQGQRPIVRPPPLQGVSSEELAPFETPRSVDPDLVKQQMSFEGRIRLEGAPEGAQFEGKTRGAPPIKTEVLGVNP
jgi:TP901 family phage tail tape measure protein